MFICMHWFPLFTIITFRSCISAYAVKPEAAGQNRTKKRINRLLRIRDKITPEKERILLPR
jgi:hypothetical protein